MVAVGQDQREEEEEEVVAVVLEVRHSRLLDE